MPKFRQHRQARVRNSDRAVRRLFVKARHGDFGAFKQIMDRVEGAVTKGSLCHPNGREQETFTMFIDEPNKLDALREVQK